MNWVPEEDAALNRPLVTVLMPVWNCERYVAEAIESVLGQSYGNFELLIVDDSSSDNTGRVISSYDDPRIRILKNATNLGVARSLLRGIEASRGTFIARIDADDVCLRSRLSRQVRYMDRHPEVAVLGGPAILFGPSPRRLKTVARRDRDIKAELLFRSPMIHPAVMFRKSLIPTWYDPGVGSAEDYDLWARLADLDVRFANLMLPVIEYRLHSRRTSVIRAHEQSSESADVRVNVLSRLIGRASASDVEAFNALAHPRPFDSDLFVAAVNLAVRLVRENDERQALDVRSLRRRMSRELAVLTAFNVGRLSALSGLGSADRSALRRMILSNPHGVASGLWYAISRKAFEAVHRRDDGDA